MAAEYGETLSEREHEITQLVAEGLTNREVADRLFLSHNTVKVHLRNIFTKTGVASRTELSMLAVQEGWIEVRGVGDGATHGPGEKEAAPLQGETQTDTGSTLASSADLPDLVPVWPWERWAAIAFGVALVLVALLLPQRQAAPASATGPGNLFGGGSSTIQITNNAAGENWQEMAPLPIRRAGMGMAARGNKIYVIGGMTDQGASGRVDIYDIETNSWREGSPRPLSLANVNAVALGGNILVPGGCIDDAAWTPSTTVHLYNPDENVWWEVAPLPTALCAYALTTDGQRAYLIGGWDGARYRALSYAYDPIQDAWEELTPPEYPRGFGGAALVSDSIYYVGGYDGERERATCEVYTLQTNSWASCRPMLQPRGGIGTTAIAGRIYAIGGGWITPLGFNERYTPSTGEWTVVETPIISEWRNLGVVSYDTALYTIGGWSGTDFLNRAYRVEIMPWRVYIPGSYSTP
jgi:DNA-binding CsgD family transcriptional regulator